MFRLAYTMTFFSVTSCIITVCAVSVAWPDQDKVSGLNWFVQALLESTILGNRTCLRLPRIEMSLSTHRSINNSGPAPVKSSIVPGSQDVPI